MSISVRNDAQEIRGVLEQFLQAWASGEVDLLDGCVAKEPFVYFSTHNNCYTLGQLKQQLLYTGKEKNVSQMRLVNELSRISGNQAVQYGIMIGLFADEDSHLAFGGSFTNKLVKTDSGWLLSKIRFELQTDDSVQSYSLDAEGHVASVPGNGDLAFIEKWQKVNTAIGLFVDQDPTQGPHTIMGECDAPWYCIPEPDNDETQEEAIQNLFLRYCYAFDFNTPDLFEGVFATDCSFLSNQAGKLNQDKAARYLTIVRQASSRAFHAVNFDEVQVNGNSAVLKATRLCPEAATVHPGENGDVTANMDTGQYELALKKEGGCWKIGQFTYRPAGRKEAQA